MRIFDITLPLSDKTPVWEGDEPVKIQQTLTISDHSDFNVSRVNFGVHSGTHIDAPLHTCKAGISTDQISLEKLIGQAHVLKIDDSIDVITKESILKAGFKKGTKRLLLKTRNTEYWTSNPSQFTRDFAAINENAASFLVEQDVWLIGIDYFSISPINNLVLPHQILLDKKIVILENAYLVNVDPGIYDLICLPMNLVGTDGAPVRAVLIKL